MPLLPITLAHDVLSDDTRRSDVMPTDILWTAQQLATVCLPCALHALLTCRAVWSFGKMLPLIKKRKLLMHERQYRIISKAGEAKKR